MKPAKIVLALTLSLLLTSCIGAVIGVAVDTTTEVIKAPFKITGAVLGVAADTTGAVIATPFRIVNAAVGGSDHHHSHSDHERHDARHDTRHDSEGAQLN